MRFAPRLVGMFVLLGMMAATCVASADELRVYMANGIKIGEVDQTSAIIWTRLTRRAEANVDGKPFDNDDGRGGKGLENLDDREGSAPGIGGEVRVTHWLVEKPDARSATEWTKVDDDRDFTRQFRLRGLQSGSKYALLVEGRAGAADDSSCQVKGSFHTAPPVDAEAKVSFVVVTGQLYNHRDAGVNGFRVYPTMKKLDPDFFIHTGDIVYYDYQKPFATTPASARFKWNRIYAMPFQRDFHNHTASYFMKDDHDVLKDDCWPGQTYGEMTFARGQQIVLEQIPMGDKPFRTIRWGKDLQIWLTEGRDFRSPNVMDDGPEKTIWGKEQKKWFFESVKKSDATFRVLISPTPMVGPDKARKRDNHANPNFAHEGAELRKFIAEQKNMFFACGDRHWQYVSVDPVSGLREFSCGPVSNKHALGFSDEDRTPMHKFLRIKGGFLLVEVDRKDGISQITLRHHGVLGKVQHEETYRAE